MDYDFLDGLNIVSVDDPERSIFLSGAEVRTKPRDIELPAATVSKIGRQRLAFLDIRPHLDKVIVYAMSWGADVEHPIGQNVARSMSATFPHHRIIIWNSLGFGTKNRSSNPKLATSIRLYRSGSLTELGAVYATHLKKHLGDAEVIDILGVSEGARVALGVASSGIIDVRNLVLIDPPGTLGVGLNEYAKRFMSESEHSKRYLASKADDNFTEVKKFDNPYNRALYFFKDICRGMFFHHYIASPKALSKRSLPADLATATAKIKGKISIVSPIYSKINDPDTMQNLNQINPNKIDVWKLEGSHAFINFSSNLNSLLAKKLMDMQ
jgi:pimeloyl-ACP methyl ester carboxylesterase